MADNVNMVTAMQQSLINSSLMPSKVGSAISTAVAAKTLQAARQEGAAVVQLLEAAGRGAGAGRGLTAGDPLVAKATGLGSLVDMTA